MTVSFERLTLGDLPLLHAWLQAPHVRAFWDDGERTLDAVEAHYLAPERKVPGFVFSVDDLPVGFLQCERVLADHDFALWASPHGETWAMDLFIGEVELTGRGLGVQVIQAFVARLCAERPGVQRILIDPSPENNRAIRAYTKVGFLPLNRLTTEDGEVQLMALDLTPA